MKIWHALTVYAVILIPMMIGWVMNIIDIINSDFELTGLFVVRVCGIFIPPLGAVLGFFS